MRMKRGKGFKGINKFVKQNVLLPACRLVRRMDELEDYTWGELLWCNYRKDENGEPLPALEHWIVTPWLGRKLEDKGEIVEFDFYGLCVWGRTCSGQAITDDAVIREIWNEINQTGKEACEQ